MVPYLLQSDLDDGIQNFQINSVSIYNKYRKQVGRLSEYLVYYRKEQFDDVATEFLSEFARSIKYSMPIPVDEVVSVSYLKPIVRPLQSVEDLQPYFWKENYLEYGEP